MSAADGPLLLHARPADAVPRGWHTLRNVPLRLSIDLPLPSMSLRALAALAPGQVLASSISTADDVTVCIGGALVLLARFEYLGGRMAVRVTRVLGAGQQAAASTVPVTPVPVTPVPVTPVPQAAKAAAAGAIA